jgi:hypothetical protein
MHEGHAPDISALASPQGSVHNLPYEGPLPTQARVEAKLLKLLASRARPLSTNDVYRTLADACDLSAAQRAAHVEGHEPSLQGITESGGPWST